MNLVSRGIRNAFRNGVRTVSIVIILGLSIGLSLTMLVAHKAVENKIANVKSNIGNTITIAPAGFSDLSQVNNALTSTRLAKVKSLAHITALDETLTDRLTTIGSAQPSFLGGNASSANTNNQTSLKSPLKININRVNDKGPSIFVNGGGSLPANFSPPVSIIGSTNPTEIDSVTGTITSGTAIDGTKDADVAEISSSMASTNNLKVGSTFTAYGTTLSVQGIFTTSDQAANDVVVVSLATEQRLSGQSGAVTSATATVDLVDNLSSATTAIKNLLGTSADVTNAQDQVNAEVQPLDSVKTVSLFSLVGSVVAGAVIILLVMTMVVRERKREIGIVKAIGGSNMRIMFEFMVESLTLTILGAIIGLAIGVIGGQPVTNALVSNSANPSINSSVPAGPGAQGAVRVGGGFPRSLRNNGAVRGLSNIRTEIGWGILLDGLGAAVVIALLGSALASGLIAKVRPSEVLRSV